MLIALIGDVMLGRVVNEKLRVREPESVWGDTLSILRQADFRICNLECAISDRGEPWPHKEFHFRTDTKNVEVLRTAGIGAVSLANNHVLDYRYNSLSDTIYCLDNAGIAHAGAGRSFDQASRPAVVSIRGSDLGIIAFTDNEPDWEAIEDQAGIFYVPINLNDTRAKKLLKLVKRTKNLVDTLIVSAHWGPNWGYEPPVEHISFGHALIDAGADIIFGHSGHVFRGVEIYKGRPIIYCAGDYIDDYAIDSVERNDESFVFTLEVDSKFFHIKLYPTKIEDCAARLAHGTEKHSIADKVQFLSMQLKSTCLWREDKAPEYLEIETLPADLP